MHHPDRPSKSRKGRLSFAAVRSFIQKGYTKQALTFCAQLSVVDVANVKPFGIQLQQIVPPLTQRMMRTGKPVLVGLICLDMLQQLAQLLIFHQKTLVFFNQFNEFFFNAPRSLYIVPICSSS
jgi:hypothetical protein